MVQQEFNMTYDYENIPGLEIDWSQFSWLVDWWSWDYVLWIFWANDPESVTWWNVLLFPWFAFFNFVSAVVYTPGVFNFVEGCHTSWYRQVLQFMIAYIYTVQLQSNQIDIYEGMEKVDFLRRLTFSYVTILEFLYPQVAYCEAGVYQTIDVGYLIYWLINQQTIQILYNVIKKFGTLSYSFMTIWECLYTIDGQCTGIRAGRFFYWLLNYRNQFDEDKLSEYDDYQIIEDQYKV